MFESPALRSSLVDPLRHTQLITKMCIGTLCYDINEPKLSKVVPMAIL